MNQPLGLDDFFVLEAGEYLDRLSGLAASQTSPNGEELVRFTRALRGSALMANQPAIARAAGALEHLLRGYRDGRQSWREELPIRTREALDVLRTLVERVRTWTPDDAARAERLALELEGAGGGGGRAAAPPVMPSETGVRAFLAREAAALGSVLDQTAKSLATGAASEEGLVALVRRLLPLRGLAALSDFPPLPDLLDGIERIAVAVSRLELPTRDGGERLAAAADALVRSAREVADRGRPDPNSPEYQRFAALLLAPGSDEVPIVAVESLFFEGEDGVVKRGLVPRPESRTPLGAASVVSRGEHLAQAADEISEASSSAQRDLRFHVLLGDLRTLATGLPAGLDQSVEGFAAAARAVISRGAAAAEALRFADILREAGSRLRSYTEITQPATLAASFEPLMARLALLGSGTPPPPAVATVPPEPVAGAPARVPGEPAPGTGAPQLRVVPIETLAPEPVAARLSDLPIVPIETLAPDGEESIVRRAPAAPAAPAVMVAFEWDLAGSFLQYESLYGGSKATAVPLTVAPQAPSPAEPPVVGIEELLYGGRAALERADQLRRQLRALASRAEPLTTIQPLVEELLDLVELAIAD